MSSKPTKIEPTSKLKQPQTALRSRIGAGTNTHAARGRNLPLSFKQAVTTADGAASRTSDDRQQALKMQ